MTGFPKEPAPPAFSGLCQAVFGTFFGHVAATVEDALGEDWTDEMADAWRELLSDLDAYVKSAPQLGPTPPLAAKLRKDFEESYAAS